MSIIVNSMWVFVFALMKCSYAAFGEQNKTDNDSKCQLVYKSLKKCSFTCVYAFFVVLRTLPWVEHILALRRSCLPCTTLPYNHTVAYPQGIRHSMYCADSSEWGLFGHNTRSAFRRTPSRKMQPIHKIARNICKNGLTLSSATQHFAFKRA